MTDSFMCGSVTSMHPAVRAGFALVLGFVAGCTTLPQVTSGQVGCAPNEISIVEEHNAWGSRTWTAECKGQRFFCSAHGGGEGSSAQISCTPERTTGTTSPEPPAAAPKATPSEAGCQYDTQCKGDRVCEAGHCVDPAASAPKSPPASDPEAPTAEDPLAKPDA